MNHTCCEEQARTFDLEKFIKRPDTTRIPVLRAGDTVFVPSKSSKSTFWKDALDVLTVVALAAGL